MYNTWFTEGVYNAYSLVKALWNKVYHNMQQKPAPATNRFMGNVPERDLPMTQKKGIDLTRFPIRGVMLKIHCHVMQGLRADDVHKARGHHIMHFAMESVDPIQQPMMKGPIESIDPTHHLGIVKKAMEDMDPTHYTIAKSNVESIDSTQHSLMKAAIKGIDNTHHHIVPNHTRLHIEALCKQGEVNKAFEVALSLMPISGDMDYDNVFLALLKACRKTKALPYVRLLYDHLMVQRPHLVGSLGNDLVITLVKCGALSDAYKLLQNLPHRTLHSWTAVIAGYADVNRGQDALAVYSLMQGEGVEPDEYTYVALFKACGIIPDPEMGVYLHNFAMKKGYPSVTFVSNTLIRMYGKCGSVIEATNVFQHLVEQDLVSWNAMLSVFVEHGHEEKTLQLYRQMIEEIISPDIITFVCAIQAIGTLAKNDEANLTDLIEIGLALHADAMKKAFTSDVYIGSTLQSMYGKFGMVVEAEYVLNELYSRNIVTWNAMLSAYVEAGEGRKALQLYRHMLEEGESPNQQTIVIALQACSVLGEKEKAFVVDAQSTKMISLNIGQALHEDATRTKGFASNLFVHNALVSMYGRCGSMAEAEIIFSRSSNCEVVSYNAMLSAYVEQGQGEKALKLYRQLQEEHKHPNNLTFVIALQACGTLAENEGVTFFKAEAVCVVALEIGHALHADAKRKGFSSHIFFSNTLISMYGKCGSITEAEHVFEALRERNIVTWNAMLSAYVDQNEGGKVLQMYTQMHAEGERPNKLTYVLLLQACGTLAEIEDDLVQEAPLVISKALHAVVKQKGLTSDVFIGSTLMSMYGKCGTTEEARTVFDEMPPCNVVPWNALLSAYVEQDQGDTVLELYKDMQKVKVTMTDITLLCVLQACGATGCLEILGQLHFNVIFTGYDLSPTMASTIIFAYRGCACITDALAVFNGLVQPAVVSWNACIAGHAHEGNCEASVYLFESMQLTGNKPDDITSLSLLTAYSHAGLIDEGLEYFKYLSKNYEVTPDLKHHTIIIDLFGRAGNLKAIEDILQRIATQVNHTIWLCVLGACRTHGNVELGKRAFDHAIKLDPTDTASYILMSNIYIDAGLQERANKLENLTYRDRMLIEGEESPFSIEKYRPRLENDFVNCHKV